MYQAVSAKFVWDLTVINPASLMVIQVGDMVGLQRNNFQIRVFLGTCSSVPVGELFHPRLEHVYNVKTLSKYKSIALGEMLSSLYLTDELNSLSVVWQVIKSCLLKLLNAAQENACYRFITMKWTCKFS